MTGSAPGSPVSGRSRRSNVHVKARASDRRWPKGVSKLEILGFSGVTSPFPKGYEANTERSDESTFSLTGRGGRFDTVWAKTGR